MASSADGGGTATRRWGTAGGGVTTRGGVATRGGAATRDGVATRGGVATRRGCGAGAALAARLGAPFAWAFALAARPRAATPLGLADFLAFDEAEALARLVLEAAVERRAEEGIFSS